jgi:hypothetical protein
MKPPSAMFAFLLVLLPGMAAAEGSDFTRFVSQLDTRPGEVSFSYGAEALRRLRRGRKERGLAAGSDGEGGVTHRVQAMVGATPWLSLLGEQSFRQRAIDDLRFGVLALEVRVRLPIDGNRIVAGALLGPRFRLDARRGSSAVAGLTVSGLAGPVTVAALLAVETSVGSGEPERGSRYALGASFPLLPRLSLLAEAWGDVAFSGSRPRQGHHLGPSMRWKLGRCWVALSVALRMSPDEEDRVALSGSTLVQVGMAL